MSEDLGRWVRRIENEEPPDLGPRIRGRQPAGEGVPRAPRGSRAATGVGIALVTIILAAGIIVPLKALWPLGARSSTPSAAGHPPSSQMYLGLWPERTLADAQRAQAAVDAGDQSQAWRTHPEEVAKHFVTDVMGWQENMGDVRGLFVQNLGNDSPCCTYRVSRALHSWAPPGPPWWETASEEMTVRQYVSPGAEGIWSVTGVRADQLTLPYEPSAEVGTDVPLQGRVDSREDHIQLGVEGGSACSQGEVATISGPDPGMPEQAPWETQVTFFRSPECGRTGDGYIALVVGGSDQPVDPLGPVLPGIVQRYIPALTMVPVQFAPTPPSPEPSPMAASSPADSPGSSLAFDQDSYSPGEIAKGTARVRTWPGNGEPGEGPFIVYLVKGTQPLWYHHLPKRAVQVGRLVPVRIGPDRYQVSASFEVPSLKPGQYAVWVCNTNCRTGFGGLVGGSITVTGSTPTPDSSSEASALFLKVQPRLERQGETVTMIAPTDGYSPKVSEAEALQASNIDKTPDTEVFLVWLSDSSHERRPVWMILRPNTEFPIFGPGQGGTYEATAVSFVDAETGKWLHTESA